MLTTNQLITLFSKSKKKDNPPEMSSMVDIMRYVNVDSGIKESGLEYYSKINLLELSKSEIPDDIIYEMVDNGWILSKDKKYIENFYQ